MCYFVIWWWWCLIKKFAFLTSAAKKCNFEFNRFSLLYLFCIFLLLKQLLSLVFQWSVSIQKVVQVHIWFQIWVNDDNPISFCASFCFFDFENPFGVELGICRSEIRLSYTLIFRFDYWLWTFPKKSWNSWVLHIKYTKTAI